MKLNKIAYLFFFIISPWASAQVSRPGSKFTNAKNEKYLYPITPGKPGSLAGTMGELRSTHFHSGIDIRTNNMTGLPVLASKSGYIARAIVSTSGYGNVLYINHPDGRTTLYAHLENFKGPWADYVLLERYNQKTSEIDIRFQKDQFTVKQGDTIAYSGNTGGSTGPHLHFDIRDSTNQALDPLKFGFTEIVDKFPPAVEKIALQTLDINSRINDRFGRFEFYAQRIGKNYILSQPIFARGTIGIEILAKDKFAVKSAFYGGVNFIDVKVDSQLVFSQAIEKIDIAQTRDIYTLMSFKTLRTKGSRFYKLYIDDGNTLQFYAKSLGTGKINIAGTRDKRVQIRMNDSYGNTSYVSFKLRPSAPLQEVKNLEQLGNVTFYDITGSVMMLAAKPCGGSTEATVFFKNTMVHKDPDYFNAYRAVYLFDLRKDIPDSISVCGNSIVPGIDASISPGSEYTFYSDRMDIQFPQGALYDTLYLYTDYYAKKNGDEIFTIGQRTVPLRNSIEVSLKPDKEYSNEKRFSVYRVSGKGFIFIGGEWSNGRITFSTREFGDYTVLGDSIPPSIKLIYADNQAARFRIHDSLSGISYFEATLNGEWLLMNFDNKTGIIWSEKRDKKIPLKGDLEVTVTDNAGNKQIFKHKIL